MTKRNTNLGGVGLALLLMALLLFPVSSSATTQIRKTKHTKTGSAKKASSKTVSSKSRSTKHGHHSRNWKRHGQQAVDGRRTQQIQQALIQSHYLDGNPSGKWDAKTQEALRRYQAANGWQSKVVPDSRALIKLGLGPSNDRLLNPDSAMTSHVEAKSAAPTPAAPGANLPQQ